MANWNITVPLCNWSAVTCSHRHPLRAVTLNLTSMDLSGSISPSLGNLSFLHILDLSGNALSGNIPTQLGRLFRLRELALMDNHLEGNIPNQLSGCKNLDLLGLSSNHLRGNIPRELGSLKHLQWLDLGENNLTAWEAHREQRRRKQHLEKALSLASSILRRKARAERRMLLDIIAEQKVGCSKEGLIPSVRNERDAETEAALPSCIIEEDPSIGDLPCIEEPRAMEDPVRASHSADDIPGCPIEEIPWQDDLPLFQAEKPTDNKVSEEQRKAAADLDEEMDSGSAPRSGSDGGMHDSLLSDEHLALVFELRSHLADMELRTLLMSQRLDIILSAFSGAPAHHKCPMCAQEFAIPARHTSQARDGDDDPDD